VNGITLTVAFVVSIGKATVALVKLSSSGTQRVSVDRVTLTSASDSRVAGNAQFGQRMAIGEFDFSRIAQAPHLLDVSMRNDSGTRIDVSIPLKEQAL
jgi:hypothetical protein